MTDIFGQLAQVLAARRQADPKTSYVASLYARGTEGIVAKIEEEADELIEAARTAEADEIIHETADLWFHTLVLLSYLEIPPDEVLARLENRFGVSGHEEKAGRK